MMWDLILRRRVASLALASLLASGLLAAGPGRAEESRDAEILRAGDNVRLSVPERPELDQQLLVDAAGNVDVGPIGEVQVAGLTVRDATELIKQRLQLIHPSLDTVILDLARSGQIRAYVLGEVGQPGTYVYQRAPSLWDLLRSSGGPLPTADLREARVIREDEGGPQVHNLDLSGVLDGEPMPEFDLKDGDTLIVPRKASVAAGLEPEEGVRVFGGVATPMVVDIDEPTPLVDVLMMAGAPTEAANLGKIWWVHRQDGVPRAELVDLAGYLKNADPRGNPLLHPGDTVNVSYTKPGFFNRTLPLLLGIATASATVYLAFSNTN